jgi:hypothetical protein
VNLIVRRRATVGARELFDLLKSQRSQCAAEGPRERGDPGFVHDRLMCEQARG